MNKAVYTKETEAEMLKQNVVTIDVLKTLSEEELINLGLKKWGVLENRDNKMLWLLPERFYNHIEQGQELVDINGNDEVFKIGISEKDTRFGCLPYGIIREGE